MAHRPLESELPRSALHPSILRGARQSEPDSIVRIVDAIEQDYQFKLGYLVIQSLVQSSQVSIEITFDDPVGEPHQTIAHDDQRRVIGHDDQRRAERLASNLQAVWVQSLPQAMRSFAYGRAAFERTYRFDATSGLYVVAGLDYLPPEHTELILDTSGGYAGVRLSVGDEQVEMEPDRTWWFALDPTATEPHGRSRYVGAPLAVWRARRQLEEQERIWYSKFAIGHGVARAPDRHDLPPTYQLGGNQARDESGELADPMEVLRRELESIESGGILILSSRTYPDGTYVYDYQESEGQRDSRPLEERRQMLDVAALRSMGIPERAITQNDQSGSRSMAQVHLEVLYRTCEGILDQLTASYQHYVVRKAVEINWPRTRLPSFRVTYRPIGETTSTNRDDANAAMVRSILGSETVPPLIRSGNVDLQRLLNDAGIPTVAETRGGAHEILPATERTSTKLSLFPKRDLRRGSEEPETRDEGGMEISRPA